MSCIINVVNIFNYVVTINSFYKCIIIRSVVAGNTCNIRNVKAVWCNKL